MITEVTTPNGEAPGAPAPVPPGEPLEQRVHRLEDAVATLQDTRRMEERVVERLAKRLRRDRTQFFQEAAGVIVDVGRPFLPAPLTSGGVGSTAHDTSPLRRSWLLLDAYAEAGAMVRMFFDPRFRPSRLARFVPVPLLAMVLTSAFWLPGSGIVVVGTLFDKALGLVLAFLAFKILGREVRRYRDIIADHPIIPRQ